MAMMYYHKELVNTENHTIKNCSDIVGAVCIVSLSVKYIAVHRYNRLLANRNWMAI